MTGRAVDLRRIALHAQSRTREDGCERVEVGRVEVAHHADAIPRRDALRRALRPIAERAGLMAVGAIDPERLTHALAVFQRTITSARSRFDAFLAGNRDALTDAELRGLHLFRTKARCINCHNGPMFTDNDFHNNGFAGRDVGRYFVSHADADSGKLKTPSLRDVTRTGPWMHDGSLQNLGDVINRYNTLRGIPGLDKRIKPLGLTRKERADLQAFLEAISADPVPFERPKLP